MNDQLLGVSIVIPAYNEAESLNQLFDELFEALQNLALTFEIIFVDDGSNDGTADVLKRLAEKNSSVRVIRQRANKGKAAALQLGFTAPKGKVIVQMDADLQDDPGEIQKLLRKLDEGYDMAVGWKQNRKDSLIKNSTSKFFNATTNFFSGVRLHDHNCGLKAYRAELVKDLHLYGELHRYIAVLAASKGYRVAEVPVEHRKRLHGKSKYGPSRFIKGCLDLITVVFLTKFQSRPLHFFGSVGLFVFLLGFAAALYLTVIKFVYGQSIGSRPLLLLSVMFMLMGVQILLTGLVGEQLATLWHTKFNQSHRTGKDDGEEL